MSYFIVKELLDYIENVFKILNQNMLYTLSFLFTTDLKKVLLIEKKRPEWQKGFLNGIGGKVEGDENFVECIERETFEETNLKINYDNSYKGKLIGNNYVVVVYSTLVEENVIKENLKQTTDEKVKLYDINNNLNLLSSVKYILPLCKESFIDKNLQKFEINYL